MTKPKVYSNFSKEKPQDDIVKSMDTKKGEEFGKRLLSITITVNVFVYIT